MNILNNSLATHLLIALHARPLSSFTLFLFDTHGNHQCLSSPVCIPECNRIALSRSLVVECDCRDNMNQQMELSHVSPSVPYFLSFKHQRGQESSCLLRL